MSTATTELVPTGTWVVDPIHSNANFEVEHAGLSAFRGGFKPIDAKLVSTDEGIVLEGGVSVATIGIDDENLRPHLLSPDFFDAERNPDVTFRATEVTGTPDDLRVVGELSMAGVSQTVEASGRLRGPVAGPSGTDALALSLTAGIDRTAFGMDWQMELPGGGSALANEIKLTVDLEFGRSE
jgi:polyisoprenoid-binding protein YceI